VVAHTGQLRLNAADLLDEFGADEQHRRLAVFDDEGDLRSGQPPVHRRHHHLGLDRAEQQFEINVAVLAEIGDALTGFDAERDQGAGDAIGLDVELGKAGPASFEFERDGIAAGFRPHPHHLGKVCRFLDLGHVSSQTYLLFF
jgi:hypothetical protein